MTLNLSQPLEIYTDGTANPTRAVCGFTAYKNHQVINETVRTVEAQSSNVAEMLAVLLALTTYPGYPLRIYSDSEYVVKTITGIYKPKKHKLLWNNIIKIFTDSNSTIEWVKSHDKNERNNRIDKLVRHTLRQKT